jgi:tRNA dimethylallyltransferase
VGYFCHDESAETRFYLMDWRGISMERPVLIAGPTASGKSALAAEIVAKCGGVVVNADALQVYDCWRVLTARASVAEEAALPHRLYGHVGRDQAYSVGHWLRDVQGVLAEGLRPVIVGGTGLYFTALTEGLAEIPPTPPDVRAEATAYLAAAGLAAMIAGLDAATASRTDLVNPARVQRAWEVQRATGRGLASWQADTGAPLLELAMRCWRGEHWTRPARNFPTGSRHGLRPKPSARPN